METQFKRKFLLGSLAITLAFGTPITLYAKVPPSMTQTQVAAERYDSSKDIFHPIYGVHGMVASEQELASQAGVEMLKKGGNAVDAAVAMGFALAVVLPNAGNIGGGGFMVVHDAKSHQNMTIDFREMAPSKATKDMYLDEKGNVIDGKSLYTILP